MNCLGLDATDRSGPSPPHIQDFRSELYIPPRSHRSEEHTSELQSPCNLVCRLLLEKKNNSSPSSSVGQILLYRASHFSLICPLAIEKRASSSETLSVVSVAVVRGGGASCVGSVFSV